MAITNQRTRERYERLRNELEASRKTIEWLLPFLNAKAKQSGDVAGLQVNAAQQAEEISKLLRFYDSEDATDVARLVTDE